MTTRARLALVTLALAGCPKSEERAAPFDATPANVTPDLSATPTPDATPTPTPTLTPTPTRTPTPTPTPSTSVDGGPMCGKKPLPDCPLQRWMKENTAEASTSGDLQALATAFERIATMAPPGYPNWASISRDGADAARAGSLDAARAACTGCHNQYNAKYRAELRTRPVP